MQCFQQSFHHVIRGHVREESGTLIAAPFLDHLSKAGKARTSQQVTEAKHWFFQIGTKTDL